MLKTINITDNKGRPIRTWAWVDGGWAIHPTYGRRRPYDKPRFFRGWWSVSLVATGALYSSTSSFLGHEEARELLVKAQSLTFRGTPIGELAAGDLCALMSHMPEALEENQMNVVPDALEAWKNQQRPVLMQISGCQRAPAQFD